jgi:hypothetical protein
VALHTHIPCGHININHPENETWIDEEEDGETIILEAGT